MRRVTWIVYCAAVAVGSVVEYEVDAKVDARPLPVYCRLLHAALESGRSSMNEKLNVTFTTHITAVGEVEMSLFGLNLGEFSVSNCSASIDDKMLNVGTKRVKVAVDSVGFRYQQKSWPHAWNEGVASGAGVIHFNISVDMEETQEKQFEMELTELELTATSVQLPITDAVLTTLLSYSRPIFSRLMQKYTRRFLDGEMDVLAQRTACSLIEEKLNGTDLSHLQFATKDLVEIHVPIIGFMDVGVSSKQVQLLNTFSCDAVSFNGTDVSVRIKGIDFDAAFDWSFAHRSLLPFDVLFFLRNMGAGAVNASGAVDVHINLEEPARSAVSIDLPRLVVDLNPSSDWIIYGLVETFATPLIRRTLVTLANWYLDRTIVGCLRDPACAGVPPDVLQLQLEESQKREARVVQV